MTDVAPFAPLHSPFGRTLKPEAAELRRPNVAVSTTDNITGSCFSSSVSSPASSTPTFSSSATTVSGGTSPRTPLMIDTTRPEDPREALITISCPVKTKLLDNSSVVNEISQNVFAELLSNPAAEKSLLVIDLRSFFIYDRNHVHTAINVSLPRALTAKKNVTMERVEALITSMEAKSQFRERKGRLTIVYDDNCDAAKGDRPAYNLIQLLVVEDRCPNVVLLQGGFTLFSRAHPELCTKPDDVSNDDDADGFLRDPEDFCGSSYLGGKHNQNDEPTEILQGAVYLGSERNAANLQSLAALNIECVLNMATECSNHFPDQFEYKNINIYDDPEIDASTFFDEAADWMRLATDAQRAVFVHCYMGISRSATAVIVYLMKHKGMPLQDAYNLVKRLRPKICPNSGFMGALIRYEKKLFGSVSLNQEEYAPLLMMAHWEEEEEEARRAVRAATTANAAATAADGATASCPSVTACASGAVTATASVPPRLSATATIAMSATRNSSRTSGMSATARGAMLSAGRSRVARDAAPPAAATAAAANFKPQTVASPAGGKRPALFVNTGVVDEAPPETPRAASMRPGRRAFTFEDSPPISPQHQPRCIVDVTPATPDTPVANSPVANSPGKDASKRALHRMQTAPALQLLSRSDGRAATAPLKELDATYPPPGEGGAAAGGWNDEDGKSEEGDDDDDEGEEGDDRAALAMTMPQPSTRAADCERAAFGSPPPPLTPPATRRAVDGDGAAFGSPASSPRARRAGCNGGAFGSPSPASPPPPALAPPTRRAEDCGGGAAFASEDSPPPTTRASAGRVAFGASSPLTTSPTTSPPRVVPARTRPADVRASSTGAAVAVSAGVRAPRIAPAPTAAAANNSGSLLSLPKPQPPPRPTRVLSSTSARPNSQPTFEDDDDDDGGSDDSDDERSRTGGGGERTFASMASMTVPSFNPSDFAPKPRVAFSRSLRSDEALLRPMTPRVWMEGSRSKPFAAPINTSQ